MESPVVAEKHSNTKSEEGTSVFHKKRSRRVSFAESTSVHIFDRDEEIKTPPEPDAPSSLYEELGFSDRDGEPRQFFGNEEEDNEDEDMDELGPRSPFFRFVRSPSSGGSTIGSATSNDEDNFFGPVSAKVIRRDLSDSATSDANHDLTMDSTSFSMHFRSIAGSDSEADLKTSTSVHLSFEEKTPTSSMLLTLNKKPNCQPDVSASKSTTASQSNDMSLVGEYHDKYDYGKLSPASDAHNDLHVVSHISPSFQVDDVMEKENKSPFIGSITNLIDMDTPSEMLLNDVSLYKSPSFLLTTETQKHHGSVSFSSLQKSISKLRILKAFPFSASLNSKLENSKSRSLISISKMTPLGTLEKNNKNKSPVNRDLHSVLQNDNIDPLPMENATSATRKRKTEDIMRSEKISRIKWSSKFFKETKLVSHSVNKMDLHSIDCFVDILEQLQRSKTYELLSNEVQSQTFLDPSSNIREKRAAETRMLLCKIVHKKAKLELMHVKRDKLLKNLQSLASGIHESEALKLKCSPQNLLNAPVIYHQDIQECQVDHGKVTSLKQEIKDTDTRISNLIESFQVSCNMKEKADTIAFVNNHLMKRARCHIIRKDLQLWFIEDLKSSKNHHYVVLNYLDLMTQRFTVTTSISVSNILKETNILKSFKDMDAVSAFQFVFDAGLTQKNVDTNLAHETQMTSSVLGNLVDVMEEIQLGRIQLNNLIHARFHTSFTLDEYLYLELYFYDPITRKKATVTLNTSCLKRGIYPSEIIACQIDSSQSDEIAAEIKHLRVGFLRVLRLCKCISQVISRSR